MSPVRIPLASKSVRYGIVVFTAGVILLASVIDPGTSSTPYGPFGAVAMDKWTHAAAYAAFTATIAYAIVAPPSTGLLRRLAFSVCLAVGFGVCVELIQWTIPYRTASNIDAIANTLGACLMAVAWLALRQAVQFGGADEVAN